MTFLLDPVLASCPDCGWELPCATEAEADRRRAVHDNQAHGTPLPPQPAAAGTWQERAADAVRQVAARGHNFTIHNALVEFGVEDPPNAKTALGTFATLVHDLQIAHTVGYGPSTRVTTKRSAAAIWNRDVRKCNDLKCKRRAGAR